MIIAVWFLGSYQCCDGSSWRDTRTNTPSPSLSHFFLFSSSFFSSLSPIPPLAAVERAALRLHSPHQAVCQFRRLALKPDMSSSAQLGRQPITMLSRALPQGWKELNTCWLSRLSPYLLVLSPRLTAFFVSFTPFLFFPFLFLSPLFFSSSPPFPSSIVSSSFIHSLSQVSSTSGSVYLFLDLSYSICHSLNSNPNLDTHTVHLSVCHPPFFSSSFSPPHTQTHTQLSSECCGVIAVVPVAVREVERGDFWNDRGWSKLCVCVCMCV